LDDVRVYNRARTATEIQTDMNTPVGGSPPPDTSPPSVPGGLAVSVSGSGRERGGEGTSEDVGVVRYDVFRSTSSGFSPGMSNRVAQPTGTSFTDGGLAAGTYYYLVEAEDAAGNLSAPSNQASAVVAGDTSPPSVPGGLAVSVSG